MIVAPSCGYVDPREKSVIVPGLSGFLKRTQDSISSHGGVALMSEPEPINGYEYGWGSTSCGVVSTREVIVIVPAFLEL